ncbi:MAG: gluconokinase [Pyrinomonadaceae bacterium MAG19_C2-C3]|nr:gluconokinase [Pyrinomonadaceae bacterium MAG19_C2-C3]
MVAIVMGVSGSGKTTIGELLAQKLKCEFADADDFHPPANVAKMSAGIPLDDDDRAPWLRALRDLISEHLEARRYLVLACSALKESYREQLQISDAVKIIYLKGDYKIIADRLHDRRGHYMNPRLLDSQFATLEEPAGENIITVDIAGTPDEIVSQIMRALSNVM